MKRPTIEYPYPLQERNEDKIKLTHYVQCLSITALRVAESQHLKGLCFCNKTISYRNHLELLQKITNREEFLGQ